jgi:hypothetical protein
MTNANTLVAEPLWTRARAMFARAAAALGGPAAIAAVAVLSGAVRRTIVGWIAPLECIVRKLLLAEAARLPVSRAGLEARMPPQVKTAPERAKPDLQRPETWRARFSLSLPADPRAVPEARAPRIRALWDAPPVMIVSAAPPPARRLPPGGPSKPSPAFRLARRFEALRRVLRNPLPHARRLARVLRRALRRFPEIVRRFALAPARASARDVDDPRLVLDAMGAGFAGGVAFGDTS